MDELDTKTKKWISKIKKRWRNPPALESNLNLPQHIFFIADGNRRWAQKHNLPFLAGHWCGAEVAYLVAKTSFRWGIPVVSLWGFSTENWKRELREVLGIINIVEKHLSSPKIMKELKDEGIRVKHIGRKDRLAKIKPSLLKTIRNLEQITSKNKQYTLFLAIDYGGRDEIIRAMRKIGSEILEGELKPDKIDEKTILAALDTAGYPEPDLIIRTSGEQRLSGAVPYQGVYAEIYFERVFFPDFTPWLLKKAIESFSKRQRRFGGRV